MHGRNEEVNGGIDLITGQVRPVQKVGIFWSVGGVIVGESVGIPEAEPYGDALQYGGHYEFWEKLKAGCAAEFKLKSHAYDYYPRGRLIFFPKRQIVRLYVDRCMNNDVINEAFNYFNHHEYEIEIERDDHYRCAGCNRYYLE